MKIQIIRKIIVNIHNVAADPFPGLAQLVPCRRMQHFPVRGRTLTFARSQKKAPHRGCFFLELDAGFSSYCKNVPPARFLPKLPSLTLGTFGVRFESRRIAEKKHPP